MDYIQLKTAILRFGEMLEAYRNNIGRSPLEQEAVQESLMNILWKLPGKSVRNILKKKDLLRQQLAAPSLLSVWLNKGI